MFQGMVLLKMLHSVNQLLLKTRDISKRDKVRFFYLTFHNRNNLRSVDLLSPPYNLSVFSLAYRILPWSHSYTDLQCYFPW